MHAMCDLVRITLPTKINNKISPDYGRHNEEAFQHESHTLGLLSVRCFVTK